MSEIDEALTDLMRQLDPDDTRVAFRKLLELGGGRPVVYVVGELCSVVHATEVEGFADGSEIEMCEGSGLTITVDADLKRFVGEVRDGKVGVIMAAEGENEEVQVTTRLFHLP